METNECQWDPPPEATEGATSEDQLEEEEVTEADITIVEMEVEASDGKLCNCLAQLLLLSMFNHAIFTAIRSVRSQLSLEVPTKFVGLFTLNM